MRLVITGAAGFVGSVLAARAAELGHEVVALDDLSRGLNAPWTPDGSTLRPEARRRIRFRRHDCQGGIAEAVAAAAGPGWRPEAVVHLAAATGSLERPLEELRARNVAMTQRVWQDARALGAAVFVWPTTSLALAVPDSPYVISKEEALAWLRAQEDRPARVPLRLFNVIGAYRGCTERRRHEVHLVPRLVECLLRGDVLVIQGDDYETADGTPSRDFVHVLDVVEAILALTERRRAGGAVPTQPDGAVWLGTGWTTTVRQVVDAVAQWVGPIAWAAGPRRPFDAGVIRCPEPAAAAFARLLGRPLAPAWVGIRDEVGALLGRPVG